jgi:hypothetical protein
MNGKKGNLPISGDLSPFERIRRTNAAGAEYWSSRDFAAVLSYSDYRNFEQAIGKARLACFNSGHRIEDHFVDVTEMVIIGSGAQRPIKTVLLRRDKVKGKDHAGRTHFEVGAKVRKTIHELGGTMPENLPPAESIKKLEAKKWKQSKALRQATDERDEELLNRILLPVC